MVTASYCTDPMQALHQDAVDAGITVVNEVTCRFTINYIDHDDKQNPIRFQLKFTLLINALDFSIRSVLIQESTIF